MLQINPEFVYNIGDYINISRREVSYTHHLLWYNFMIKEAMKKVFTDTSCYAGLIEEFDTNPKNNQFLSCLGLTYDDSTLFYTVDEDHESFYRNELNVEDVFIDNGELVCLEAIEEENHFLFTLITSYLETGDIVDTMSALVEFYV